MHSVKMSTNKLVIQVRALVLTVKQVMVLLARDVLATTGQQMVKNGIFCIRIKLSVKS